MRHVVAVADPRDLFLLEFAEVLQGGEVVGHGLTWVRQISQAVDNRDRGVFGQIGDGFVRESARHDAVDVAREDFGGVGDRLATAELDVARGEKQGVAAELEHADLERHARARRRLLENHRQRLALQRVAKFLRILLDLPRQLEDPLDFGGREVVNFDEVLMFHLMIVASIATGFMIRRTGAISASRLSSKKFQSNSPSSLRGSTR